MTRRSYHRDPMIWLIFAVAVSLPSVEYARLRRARETSRAAPPNAPRVEPAGQPRVVTPAPLPAPPPSLRSDQGHVAADEAALRALVDSARYAPVKPASTPIVTSVLPSKGNVAAVLEESGRVTLWDVDLHKEVGFFMSDLPALSGRSQDVPRMTLVPSVDLSHAEGATPPLVGIIASDGLLHVWNAGMGAKLFTTPVEAVIPPRTTPRVIDAVWSGMTLATTLSSDGRVANWMVSLPAESALVSRPRSPGGYLWGIDANMDHGLVAVAATGGLYVNSRGPGWIVLDSGTVKYPPMYPRRVLISPDGKLVASAWNDGEIRVYSTETGARVRTMRYEGGFPTRLAFSRDGTLLAATGIDVKIRVWSTTTDSEPLTFRPPRGPLRSMWFAPHGRRLVTVGWNERYLREWVVPEEW